MIRDFIEQAIRNIEAEREQKVAAAKATIMQEKVLSHNIEVDMSRDNALQALAAKREKDISEINARYEAERQAIIDASEKSKTDNANEVIARETVGIAAEYDTKLAELRKLIEA